jgi:RNA recognition motif-containing protein
MFRSRNEWFAHELQNHRREWVCISCLESFTDRAQLSEHLQSMHSSLVAGSQLEALVLQCEEPVDKIPASSCLLCDEWESNLLDPKQDSKRLFLNNGEIVEPCGTLGQFRRHLGRHMEQLALFALPMAEEDEMEDDSLGEGSDDSDGDLKEKDNAFDPKDDDVPSDVEPFPEDLEEPILRFVQGYRFSDLDELAKFVFEQFRSQYALSERDSPVATVRSYLAKRLEKGSESSPWLVMPEVAHMYLSPSLDEAPENEGASPKEKVGDENIDSHSEEFYYGLIDRAVPLGPDILRQTFQKYPGIWSYIPHIQTKIEGLVPKQLAQAAWGRDFNNLIDEMLQHDEETRKSDLEAYHHNMVDVALRRGPAALRDVLEKYPLLLANSDYYGYLRRAIATLPASKQALMDAHINDLLSVTLVIKSIPVAIKKSQFVDIMAGIGLPVPEALSFQSDSGIFKGRAFARFDTVGEADQVMAALDGFQLQGRRLRVEPLKTTAATVGGPRFYDVGSSEQTVDTSAETGPEEVATSETDTSKVAVSHIVTLGDAASEDFLAENVLDKIAISGKPTLVAFLQPTERISNIFLPVDEQLARLKERISKFLPVYEQLAQDFAFARDKLTIAKVDVTDEPSQSYPIIRYYTGKNNLIFQYEGGKDLKNLTEFLIEKTGLKPWEYPIKPFYRETGLKPKKPGEVPVAEPGSPTETSDNVDKLFEGNVTAAAVPAAAESSTIEALPSLSIVP